MSIVWHSRYCIGYWVPGAIWTLAQRLLWERLRIADQAQGSPTRFGKRWRNLITSKFVFGGGDPDSSIRFYSGISVNLYRNVVIVTPLRGPPTREMRHPKVRPEPQFVERHRSSLTPHSSPGRSHELSTVEHGRSRARPSLATFL